MSEEKVKFLYGDSNLGSLKGEYLTHRIGVESAMQEMEEPRRRLMVHLTRISETKDKAFKMLDNKDGWNASNQGVRADLQSLISDLQMYIMQFTGESDGVQAND